MSMRKLPLLVIALLIALATVFVARTMLSGGSGPVAVEPKAPPTYEILVAARDLPAGTILAETDMKWQIWPKEEGETGYAVKGTVESKDFVGNVVRYGIQAGEPVATGRVVKPGEQGFMAAALAPGMRAVSIAITPVAGVAGFVFPGDRVDVIVTHQIGRKSETETTERKVSETMLKDVRVLALDQKMSNQVTEPKVAQIATLEVSPKQAETIALISELGTVSLALRSIANDPAEVAEPAKPEGSETAVTTSSTTTGTPAPATIPPVDASLLDPNQPPALEPVTWDSDVSKVLPRPANRSGAVQKIQIIRGKEITESIFDLQQP